MYRRATWVVVKFRSTSGLPLATRALARRSMVPPTSNSTGVPVLAVKAFPITRSTVSFQLPPHTLTTSEFWAWAEATGRHRASSDATTRRASMASLLFRPRRGAGDGRRGRLGGRLDGLDDEVVAGAAAEVPGQHLADLLARGRGPLAEKRAGAHDDPGGAVAALEPVLGPERFLHRMQALGGSDAFDGGDAPAVGLDRQHEAGADRLAFQQDGARPAHAVLAAHVGAGQLEVLSQEVGQGLAHLHRALVVAVVDRHPDRPGHRSPPQRASAAASVRSASVAATCRRYAAVAWMSASGERAATAARAASAMSAGVGAWPARACSTTSPRTGVPPAPKKARRARATVPSAASAITATAPTSAKSPWRRETSAKPQPAPAAGRVKRTAVANSSAESAVVSGAR